MRLQRGRDRTPCGVLVSIKLVSPRPWSSRWVDDGRAGEAHGSSLVSLPADKFTAESKEKAGNIALVTYEALELKRNRPRDVAALHAMQAARPLKPPPHDFGERRPVAALIAVREDRKAGILV